MQTWRRIDGYGPYQATWVGHVWTLLWMWESRFDEDGLDVVSGTEPSP